MDMSSAHSVVRRPLPGGTAHHHWAMLVDRVGATASLLCAVHCALLPFVLALLPLVGLAFLAGPVFERVFVACAVALASGSLLLAYRRHRRPHALLLMLPGIALLLFGIFVDVHSALLVHTVSVVAGGVLVASAHVTNLVLSHRHCGPGCAHPAV